MIEGNMTEQEYMEIIKKTPTYNTSEVVRKLERNE